MKYLPTLLARLLPGALLAATALSAHAAYPEAPIRMIVPFST